MRNAAAALLCLGAIACSEQQPEAQPKSPAPAAIQSPAPWPGPQGAGLQGQVSSLKADVSGLTVRVTEFGTVVELPTDTLFEFDKAELSPTAEANLVKAADAIRRAGAGPISVVGHTDAKGEEAYNLALSQRRAEAVAAWLRGQVGVRQREISVSGKGESAPVAPNARPDGSDDPDGRGRNRRVELVIANA